MVWKLTRREFLKSGTGAASVFLGSALAGRPNGAFGSPREDRPDVVVVKGRDHLASTEKAVALLGGMERFVAKGSKVAILPNTQSSHPGTFTKPDIVRAVVRLCKQAGAREINCLSWLPRKSWAATGLSDVLEEEGAALKLAEAETESLFRPVALTAGKLLREAMIMRELFENDVLINLPITKDHAGNRFTGAMKNMMGLNFSGSNRTFHSGDFKSKPDDIDRLDQCIADLNLGVAPGLHIVDATEIIKTNGPFGPGELISPGKIVAGVDRVAVDSYCATVLGLKPEEILMIRKAYEHGLGEMNPKRVRIMEVSG
jgi:uncharacterized protein (DUF362 family)